MSNQRLSQNETACKGKPMLLNFDHSLVVYLSKPIKILLSLTFWNLLTILIYGHTTATLFLLLVHWGGGGGEWDFWASYRHSCSQVLFDYLGEANCHPPSTMVPMCLWSSKRFNESSFMFIHTAVFPWHLGCTIYTANDKNNWSFRYSMDLQLG